MGRTYNWNRKLLNYLWVMVGVSVLVPVINFPFTDLGFNDFLLFRLMLPLVSQLFIMGVLEHFSRKSHAYKDYFLILGSMGMVFTMNLAHAPVVHVMLSLFILPIFIGIFTIEAKKIVFAFLLSFFSFLALNTWHPSFSFDTVETITFVFILSSAAFLSLVLTKRYKHLSEELKASVSNEKELLFKTIQMEKMSKLDLPTNLYNHKTFHEYFEKLWDQCQKSPFQLHLALLDLDNFKKVNDQFGHATGDVVIKEMASIIRAFIDTNDFPSRYGGEEFAILFTEKSTSECEITLEYIRKSLEAFPFEEMSGQSVTVSIGLSKASNFESKESFFKATDFSLYEAKANGKNQIVKSVIE